MFDMIGVAPICVWPDQEGQELICKYLTLPYNAPNIGTDWCPQQNFLSDSQKG